MTTRIDEEIAARIERRDFLSLSTKLAGILGALGLTTESWAQAGGSPARRVLDQAITGGDASKALQSSDAAQLSAQEKDAISRLTPDELTTLKSVQGKLSAVGRPASADGAGVF